MFFLKKIVNVAAIGCLGICTTGLIACIGEEEEISNPSNPQGSQIEDPSKDPGMKPVVEEITTKDPDGNVVVRAETLYVSVDDSVHWVGNSSLKITEITPVNLDWLDEEGSDPGWVEIYNAGSTEANLKGYTLVENTANARKWFFGNVTIPAKGFLNVFCDNKDLKESPNDLKDTSGKVIGYGRPHTNWKLEKKGGSLYLIDPYFAIRDSVAYPSLEPGMSWGITDGGAWKYFDKPTPEKPNTASTGYDAVAPDFTFNGAAGGFYNDELVLNAPKTSDGLKVRCTQNGSEPTKDSQPFDQDIVITKSTVLRCAAFKDGMLTKKIVTNTYFIDEVVNMPVVAVTVDSAFFRDHYVPKSRCSGDNPNTCPAGLMQDIEFPAHVEYFADGSKTKEKTWEIEAGVSLMGGWSRVADKKSLAVVMREEYEAGWLHYSLFETRKSDKDKYKAFNLRNNGNRFVSDYIEDAVGGAALEGTGVDYQRSRQVVVFYNGKYWGIHDMRERFNKNYVESNYKNISADDVDIIKILGHMDSSLTGNTDAAVNNFKALLTYVGSNDFSGENNEAFAQASSLMDMSNFAKYMAAEIYYKNGDWPNNNVRAWRAPDHLWKFMIYDLDHGFGWKWGVNGGEFSASSTNMFDWIKKGGGNKPCKVTGCFANLYIQLIKNPDFKRIFLNNAAILYQNYVNTTNISKVVDRMVASMNSADIERDQEKFHPHGTDYGEFSKDGKVFKEWSAGRDDDIYDEFKDEFGLSGTIKVSIAADGNGEVLVDGSSLPSKDYSGKFFGGVSMKLEAVAGEGAMFGGWSDGVKDEVRIVDPTDGATYKAIFK